MIQNFVEIFKAAYAGMNSAVMLLSGGLDSSVLLALLRHIDTNMGIVALSCNYGQRHAKELGYAQKAAKRYGVSQHFILPMDFMAEMNRAGSALLGGLAVPDLADLSEQDRQNPPTYVPMRNTILLALAASCAETRGIRNVFYGAQQQDAYGYWDCTGQYVGKLNALFSSCRRDVVINAPFITLRKSGVVQIGHELGVEFAHTWSCYRGEGLQCGTCPTCVERRNAFKEAGVLDPIPYEKD